MTRVENRRLIDVPKPAVTSTACGKVHRAKYEVMLTDAAWRQYCRRVTAASIEAHRLPPVPHTMAGIRKLLPAEMQVQFDDEFAAVDLDDLTAVAKLRDHWWCRAAVATNPDLLAGIRDDEPMFPSPLR